KGNRELTIGFLVSEEKAKPIFFADNRQGFQFATVAGHFHDTEVYPHMHGKLNRFAQHCWEDMQAARVFERAKVRKPEGQANELKTADNALVKVAQPRHQPASPTNEDFVQRAEEALYVYGDEGHKANLTDCLADLMHWSGARGVDFKDCLARAEM